MQEFRSQHHSRQSSTILTPKNSYNNTGPHAQQSSPLKSKSKGTKETLMSERPKPGRTRPNDQNGLSQRQLDISGLAMQRLLLEKNNNNLYGSFYNSGSKSRDKDNTNFVTIFKLRETQRESGKESQRESPFPTKLKNIPEKHTGITTVAPKSYRRDETDPRSNDTSCRQISRQKSNIQADSREYLNKTSSVNMNISSHKYTPEISPEKQKPKSSMNLAEVYISNIEQLPKKTYKLADVGDHERHLKSSSLYNSRHSPQKQSDSSVKVFEFVPADVSRGYKSAYRPQQEEDWRVKGNLSEMRNTGTSRRQHKRGASIDQGSQNVYERPQSSRREKERRPAYEEPQILAQSLYERRMTPQRQEPNQHHYQQQYILQYQHQHHHHHHQQQQQQQQQPQQKHQAQEVIVINNEQDQVKYFEKLLHIDKVTFDFEKQMIMRRAQKLSSQNTPLASTTTTKHSSHTRTRSMEDPGSLIHTKSSSRWNTKRSAGEDAQNIGYDTTNEAIGVERLF